MTLGGRRQLADNRHHLERFLLVAIQREGATGSQWVEAGDATGQPIVLGTALPGKDDPTPDVIGAKAEKPALGVV